MKQSLNTSAPVTADSPKGQRATETFRAQYNKAGLNPERAQFLNEHPSFAAYLLAGIKRFSTKVPDHDLICTILGKDFIGPAEMQAAGNFPGSRLSILVYDYRQLYATVPSQEVLEWCHDNGYMLVAGPPRSMSLLDITNLRPDYFSSSQDQWYANEEFAHKDKVNPGWVMIRKEPVPRSMSKKRGEQQDLLSDVEMIPNAAEVAWCVTAYKTFRDTYLLPNMYVRTSSHDAEGCCVSLGNFRLDGCLGVNLYGGDERHDDVGIASSRKRVL